MSKSKKQGRAPITSVTTNPNSTAQTVAAPTPAAKPAKVEDPQVAAAKAALAKAKEQAKAAEDAAKAKRAEERKAAAAAKAATKAEPRPTCGSTKKDGTPCTAKCVEGKSTCVDHQPAWDRLTHEEHQAFGAWLRKARGEDIVQELGWFRAKQIAKEQAAKAQAVANGQ